MQLVHILPKIDNDHEGVRFKMGKKRFSIHLTLSELYGIRNALRKSDTDKEILKKIENKIKALHDFFDGRSRYIKE